MSALYDTLHPTVANLDLAVVPPHPGTFHPVGIMLHHTGSASPALSIVQHGRPDLAGPLAHLNITRTGHVHVVTDGLAWHAGRGDSATLDATRHDRPPSPPNSDDIDGNPWYYGIEVDNDGAHQPYPDIQIAALVYTCAAICRHHHWTANRVVHHREWTTRKPDMSYRGAIRAEIAKHL